MGGAYDYMEKAIKGLLYGIVKRIEGGWVCRDSAGIRFGAPVFGYVGDENSAYNYYNDTAKLVFDGDFVADNLIRITVNEEAADDVTFDTDHDTTAGLIVDAVNALDGVEAVIDDTDATNRTFLIRVKGKKAEVSEEIAGGAGQVTGTVTYGSGQVFVGIALFTQKGEGLGSAEFTGYEVFDAVNVLADGELWVEVAANVQAQEKAYVIATAGATVGKFGAAGTEVNAKYRSSAVADGLARLHVEGQTLLTYASRF